MSGRNVGIASTANTTQYLMVVARPTWSVTEANQQTIFRSPGTLSDFYIRLTANSVAGTSTFTSRKNLADGGQTVSVGSSATGEFHDISGTDSVVAGDKFAVSSVPGATTGTYSITICSMLFAATTDTVTRLGMNNSQSQPAASGAVWFFILGGNTGTNTETGLQIKMRQAGTFKNLAIFISANTITATSTHQFRKNTANGTLVSSIGASTTGTFEDTTHSDTVTVDDLVDHQFTPGATGTSITPRVLSVDFVSTSPATYGICGVSNSPAATTIGLSATNYYPLNSDLGAPNTVEADTQMKARALFTFSDLSANVSANTITATTTIFLRKNAANGNNTLSIGSSATGFFQDTTHNDFVTALTDEFNYRVVTGGTGTSITIQHIAIMTKFTLLPQTVWIEWEES